MYDRLRGSYEGIIASEVGEIDTSYRFYVYHYLISSAL